MSEAIDRVLFDHLVQLAALDMSPAEAEYLLRELNHQLSIINELTAIPIAEDLPIIPHGVPYTPETRPPLRSDQWVPYQDAGLILAQAPESEDGYIVAPDIRHSDLD
ncbi:MAG: aspartyl/glutamyl-tRNA amidotransferase subunit C [Anaerolineaceae bacterium]|jgi:aspartyl/glutamyl-tRNA(Asn/Gln) amidotransferase C subunit